MDNEYMEKRDYETLDIAAGWLESVDSDLAELRAAFGALYPDNGRAVTRKDFEDAISAFEQSQKALIKALDALIP